MESGGILRQPFQPFYTIRFLKGNKLTVFTHYAEYNF